MFKIKRLYIQCANCNEDVRIDTTNIKLCDIIISDESLNDDHDVLCKYCGDCLGWVNIVENKVGKINLNRNAKSLFFRKT